MVGILVFRSKQKHIFHTGLPKAPSSHFCFQIVHRFQMGIIENCFPLGFIVTFLLDFRLTQIEILYGTIQRFNMCSLDTIKFWFLKGKMFFIHFPINSYAKTMTCDGDNLGFLIKTKNTNFVQDHSSEIPAKFACNSFRLEYFVNVFP